MSYRRLEEKDTAFGLQGSPTAGNRLKYAFISHIDVFFLIVIDMLECAFM